MSKRKIRKAQDGDIFLEPHRTPIGYRAQHPAVAGSGFSVSLPEEGDTVKDVNGQIAAPLRVYDVLRTLWRNGSISNEEYDAGRNFESLFQGGNLNQLRAQKLERTGFGHAEISEHSSICRDSVWRAMLALGGPLSYGGQVVWRCLGSGMTIKEASEDLMLGKKRRINQQGLQGSLIAALGVLCRHYGYLDINDLNVPQLQPILAKPRKEERLTVPKPPKMRVAHDIKMDHPGGTLSVNNPQNLHGKPPKIRRRKTKGH